MNDQIITILNHIPLGTGLLIIVGLISLLIGILKKAKKYKDMYDKEIREKLIKEEEKKEDAENYKKKVDDVSSSLNNMTISIDKMGENIKQFENNISSGINQFEFSVNSKLELMDEEIKSNHILNKKNIDSLGLEIEKHTITLNKLETSLSATNDNVSLLIESDKEDIKAYITNEYNKWMEKEYIDLITLQSIEARFSKYIEEKGNGFVKKLMNGIRSLPTEPPKEHKRRKDD